MLKTKSDKIALAILLLLAAVAFVHEQFYDSPAAKPSVVKPTKDTTYQVFDITLRDSLAEVLSKLSKAGLIKNPLIDEVSIKDTIIALNVPDTGWLLADLMPDDHRTDGRKIADAWDVVVHLKSPVSYVHMFFLPTENASGFRDRTRLSDNEAIAKISSGLGQLVGLEFTLDEKALLKQPRPLDGNSIYTRLLQKYGEPDSVERGNGSMEGPGGRADASWSNRLAIDARWISRQQILRYVVYADISGPTFALSCRNTALVQSLITEWQNGIAREESNINRSVNDAARKL